MTTPLTLHIDLPEGAVQATTRKERRASGDALYFIDVQLDQRWPVAWKEVAEAPSNAVAILMVQEMNLRIRVLAALTS